jgi:hypothetical protein
MREKRGDIIAPCNGALKSSEMSSAAPAERHRTRRKPVTVASFQEEK